MRIYQNASIQKLTLSLYIYNYMIYALVIRMHQQNIQKEVEAVSESAGHLELLEVFQLILLLPARTVDS